VNRYHIRNMERATAAELGAFNGFARVIASKPCQVHSRSSVERVAEGRRIATANGVNFRAFAKWRPDLISFHPRLGRPKGWDPAWALMMDTERQGDEISRIYREWTAAGRRFMPHPNLTADGNDVAEHTGGGWPQMYTAGGMSVYALVADLRYEEYREFAANHCLELCELYSLDGVMMDAKTGWHVAGSPDISRPGHEAGGVLWPSPYLPGEFEEAFADLIRRLHMRGIRPVTVHRPRIPDQGPWDWMPDDVRAMPLGEYE